MNLGSSQTVMRRETSLTTIELEQLLPTEADDIEELKSKYLFH